MIKIGITGGKGGTGKSTFSILLANKLRKRKKKIILFDADVECPNDYLLLGQNLKSLKDKIYAQFPKIDENKCVKCGLCVKNCRSNAIFQSPGKFPVFLQELCSSCGLCWHLCPQKAIGIEKKVIGEIFEKKINDNFYLITGRSVGIVDETGPVVTKAREYADNLAKKIKADYLLTDTAVGMHCGVIRALIGADLVYAVTEPTPLGSHDLELMLSLLKILNLPTKIVLNQFDLGERNLINKIAQKNNIKIKYKIPHSRKLVNFYSQGKLEELNLLSKL